MLHKKFLLLLWALVCTGSAIAQNTSFHEFRKELFDEYSTFRNSILDKYDKFLERTWSEYDSFRGESRYPVPKPSVAPRVTDFPSTTIPSGKIREIEPITDMSRPQKEDPQTSSETPATTSNQSSPIPFCFPFFGMDLQIPSIDFNVSIQITNTRDYAEQWRELEKNGIADQLLPYLEALSTHCSLNDYLKYELLSAYVHHRFVDTPISSRISLVHYLLTHLGYDARIAVNGVGHPLILIPFQQDVYAHPYLVLDNRKYYVFSEEKLDMDLPENRRISTYDLPVDSYAGNIMDLTLTGLNLPYEPHHFDIASENLRIHGEVNKNIFKVLYNYPQMPTSDFARSEVCPDVRRNIVEQLALQLDGMSQTESVNSLLTFVQSFDYSADEDSHGFEKPYFFEEMLFYPQCDCEDRAIFYTYLLWNVLGVENHLICYPGHESAAVNLSEEIRGDAYIYQGSRFYISDPTYIGSSTGMCMPMFANETPQIDFIYKK